MIGTTLSHYRILEKVGGGGMGEVYLAEDLKLRRKVAIKVLPPELTQDSERRRRFMQEARAAAAIEHPHIAAVYDVDDDHGVTFIAMEYVRGRSLREAIRAGPFALPEALELALQVVEGLAKVHDHGIVHRDLKPENIVISEEGYAKIIDFGLAKLLEPAAPDDDQVSHTATQSRVRTSAGEVLGTVAYMSPEQAKGVPVDAKSDIFSFGIVLYEMLSGTAPFKRGSSIETLSAILRDTPEPVHVSQRRTPPELHRILRRALAKDPAERYGHIREMAGELRALRRRLESGRADRPSWRLIAPLLALVLLPAGGWWLFRPGRTAAAAAQPVSVLIADFENKTPDPVFDGALEQALGIGLEGASFISSFARPQARRLGSELQPSSGGRLDEPLALLVCRRQGVRVLIAGAIDDVPGQGYVLTARALDAASGQPLAHHTLSAKGKSDVLSVAGELAAALRKTLGDKAGEAARVLEAETFSTASLEAMNTYARAQELWTQGKYDESLQQYWKAIDQDPSFGRAYAGLAVQLANMGQREEAEKYFKMALARVDGMSERERHRTIGGYYLSTRDYGKAVEEFSALVRDFPADNAGHANLALAYFYSGDMRRALDQGRKAVELYPNNLLQKNNVALYAVYAGEFQEAEREARAVLELNAQYEKGHLALAMALVGQGKVQAAEQTYRELQGLSVRGASLALAGLADIALAQGRSADAVRLLESGIAADTDARIGAGASLKAALLAEALALRGQTVAAQNRAEQAAKASKQEGTLVTAARAYFLAGNEAKAARVASELASRLVPVGQAYGKVIEGEILLHRGRAREAVPVFQAAQGLMDTWLGRLGLGRAYLEAGAFPEAYTEFSACLKRKGEAMAAFLDDVPTYRYLPSLYYSLGRAQEGLGSPAAPESFRVFVELRGNGEPDPTLVDARQRLAGR